MAQGKGRSRVARRIEARSKAAHKRKFCRDTRENLKSFRSHQNEGSSSSNTIHFGSMNVRGLDISAEYAIHKVIEKRRLDVST